MINVLKDLKLLNAERNDKHFQNCYGWSESDWGNAIAGEVGEMCNLIKKRKLGNSILIHEVGKEMADIIIYLDLLATKMGIDLGMSVINKFNEKSFDIGSDVRFKDKL